MAEIKLRNSREFQIERFSVRLGWAEIFSLCEILAFFAIIHGSHHTF